MQITISITHVVNGVVGTSRAEFESDGEDTIEHALYVAGFMHIPLKEVRTVSITAS